jgi:hypothetical protein
MRTLPDGSLIELALATGRSGVADLLRRFGLR